MNELSKFLVESILNEAPEKVVALFGGGFKPPTKGHLDVVLRGLQQNPEITQLKILVGGKERNGFTQRQAVKIWNLYNDLNFIPVDTKVVSVSSPFDYYKKYLRENPDDKVYIFIGSRPEDEKDQFDVKQRSEFIKKYSDNAIPVEVSTGGGISGTMARKLFKTNIDDFRNMFPENLTDGDWKVILNILGKKDIEENLILERIKLTPDEVTLSNEVLKRAKKIFQRGTPSNQRMEGVAVMPFTSADSKPGKVSFYVDHKGKPGNLGYYNKKKINDLEDDIIVLNGSFFSPAYSAILPAVFNKVTGENPDKYLLDTIKHELIHAKDPGVNQEHLKEPYDSSDNRLYYGTWTEFPAQTGEFLEAISAHAEEKLRNNPSDKEIQILERVLQNILDVYAGKEKAFYNQTVDFINGGPKKNIFQEFIKKVIDIGGKMQNIFTIPDWDSMNTFTRYYTKVQKIKKYNPEGYKEFLKDLYKEIKGIEEMVNFYLKEKAKAQGLPQPKKFYVGGKGKKPKGSGRRLYTDEDPKDTVGVKFSTRQDIVDTLNKKSFKAKSHARQSQIINLIHQRVRAALSRTKDPAKKKKLKSGFEYIKGKKEASKKKTQRLKKQKLNESVEKANKIFVMKSPFAPKGWDFDHIGFVLSNGMLKDMSGHRYDKDQPMPPMTYKYENTEELFQMPKDKNEAVKKGLYKEKPLPKSIEIPDKVACDLKDPNKKAENCGSFVKIVLANNGIETTKSNKPGDIFLSLKENIDPASQKKHKGKAAPFGSAYKPVNENTTYSNHIDYKQQIRNLTKHMVKKGMNILPLPKVIFKHGDQENASTFFGKTAYYDPRDKVIVLYTEGRHPKDVVRSFAHEMIHHIQNLEDRLENISTTNTMEDDHLNDIEREAYTRGNMTFRNWTDSIDGEEVTSLNENTGDSNPLKLKHIDTWHNGQYKVEDGNIEDGIKLMTQAANEAEKLAREKQDGGVAGEANYYKGTIAWLKKDYNTVKKYINDKFVKLTGNDEVLSRLLKNKDKPYKEAYHLKENNSLNKKNKDPFGLNQYARELMKEFQIEDIKPIAESVEKQKEVRIFNKNCDCDKT